MDEQPTLQRSFGLFTATMIGVGAMIGAGIFVLTGIAAGVAGPALVLVFLFNGLIALLTAMVYAELGSAIPEAGGGYVWVKRALPSIFGFMGGWMSWFANALAGSLYALGFGAYFGEIFDHYDLALFGLHGMVLKKVLAVIIGLIFIYINYRGSSEIATVGNVITGLKIAILAFFVLTGVHALFGDPMWFESFIPLLPNGYGAVFAAMGLTFIAFEGYEIIAQSGEELKNPKRNVPRAIFISLGVVVVIYLLIAVVSIGVVKVNGMTSWEYLGIHKELGLLEAAKQFMPYGAFFLLVGGVVSTMSALNATLFASTRVFFSMGRDFNLPKIFGKIHPKTFTPVNALMATGLLILFAAVLLPIEHVAAATGVMFLLLFSMVCVSQVLIRRKEGEELDYGFRVPFFPYLSYLGAILNVVLALYVATYSPLAWVVILFWCAMGLVFYYSYSKSKEEVESRRKAIEENPKDFHIVAALDNYDDVKALTTIGASVAKETKSNFIALNVIQIPYDTYLHSGGELIRERDVLVERAKKAAKSYSRRLKTKTYVSHKPTKAIIDFTRYTNTNLLLIGWSNNPYNYIVKGEAVQKILERARANVAIVRDHNLKKIKKILLPFAFGVVEPQFRVNIANAIAKANKAEITILSVIDPNISEEKKKHLRKVLSEIRKQCTAKVKTKIVEHTSYVDYLIKISGQYDLMIVGPSREWISHSVVLGIEQDKIANHAACTVMMIKQIEPRAETWFNLLFRKVEDYGVEKGWFGWN